MKLKYYLRGLGIGIICTAIIMGIALSGNQKETLSDAEIIERARMLGMVMPEEVSEEDLSEDADSGGTGSGDASVPGDAQETESGSGSEAGDSDSAGAPGDAQEGTGTDAQDGAGTDAQDGAGTDAQDGAGTDAQDAPESPEEAGAAGDTAANVPAAEDGSVTIEVAQGDFSMAISQKLYDAGLIQDVDEFNEYMVQRGVDDSLSIGKHEIPRGSTEDQIIAILQGET